MVRWSIGWSIADCKNEPNQHGTGTDDMDVWPSFDHRMSSRIGSVIRSMFAALVKQRQRQRQQQRQRQRQRQQQRQRQ